MENKEKLIFLVDDDRFHLELMRQLLEGEGVGRVNCYENGVDCLNDVHLNPDVVFLDHQMDIFSGFEILRKIKRYDPNVFVVMVSGQEDIDTAVESLKHGAFDYIKKDTHQEEKVKAVLHKIDAAKELLKSRKPTLLKSIFKYI